MTFPIEIAERLFEGILKGFEKWEVSLSPSYRGLGLSLSLAEDDHPLGRHNFTVSDARDHRFQLYDAWQYQRLFD